VTHDYPPRDFDDSVTRARVNALRHLGFTERQREFLLTVMVHSGSLLERQYCAFTGTVRGQNSREFMSRLTARGFVRVIEPGPLRRGRLYHIHHSRCTKRSARPTTETGGFALSAGWSSA
jgi:hypothetical protein